MSSSQPKLIRNKSLCETNKSCVDKSNDSAELSCEHVCTKEHALQTGKIDGEMGMMSEDINITPSNNRLIKDREYPERLKQDCKPGPNVHTQDTAGATFYGGTFSTASTGCIHHLSHCQVKYLARHN